MDSSSLLLLFFFLLILVPMHGAADAGGCRAREREALLQFKKETYDYEGRMLSSWDEEKEEDCCRWKGVSCHNTTGHVVGLQLPGNRYQNDYYLNASISSSLLELRFLEYLDLSGNNFNLGAFLLGTVGSLKNLKLLNLTYSYNYGMDSSCKQVPHWGNLSKLEVLDLYMVSYDPCSWGSCEWVSHLSSLKYLSMRGANLSEATNLFQAINRMPSLSYLDLSGCNLVQFRPTWSGLTPQYINFTMLKHLDLSVNKLVFKPPHWIGNLTSLEYLDLSYNSLLEDHGGFLLRNLSRLQTVALSFLNISSNLEDFLVGLRHGGVVSVDLRYTDMSGHIPEWIRTCRSLKTLYFEGNNLSGPIPKSIWDLPSLEYLDLSFNRLDGPISPSIGMLRSLEKLDLSYNGLNGSIPESLWQLHLLSDLELSGNSLHGVVTEQHLSNLPNLDALYLDGKSLQLKVPLEWVPPFNLSWLFLSGCILQGQQFPRWIRTQKQLFYLSMPDSCISGALPRWIWNFSPSLSYVYLSGNMLTGAIPVPVANTSLYTIDLSSNRLHGSLPRFTNNTGLTELNLSNNSLSGHILLDDVSYLRKLDLSMNNFSGTVPPSLCNARQLVGLYLSDNQLSGSLPNCICETNAIANDWNMIDLRLNRNHLNGIFPQFLRNCTSMINLDLGENKLSGEIPDWIAGSMVHLRILRLAWNRFNGSIPENLGNLTELRILDLSHNHLSGPIPSSFGRLAAMKTKPAFGNDEYNSPKSDLYLNPDKQLILQIKGALLSYYTKQLKHVKDMDLSGNHLCGQIPLELGNLAGLQGLNLSNNHLSGNFAGRLGNISFLESLDLSKNKLSGGIPRDLEVLSFMGTFDVSYNNLSGKIPTEGQFHTFSNTSYIGNTELCGPPLSKPCATSSPQNPDGAPPNAGKFDTLWLLLGLVPGFVLGFWIFWGPLLLVTRWRYAYFRFLDDVCYKYLCHYLFVF